jgi:hypothetical protein
MFQRKVAENIQTRILCSITFSENRAVYEIMWENPVEPDRPQMTTWRMRIACWIPKATDTHSEYAILLPFPLQQWLQKRALMLRYTYIACLVFCKFINPELSYNLQPLYGAELLY